MPVTNELAITALLTTALFLPYTLHQQFQPDPHARNLNTTLPLFLCLPKLPLAALPCLLSSWILLIL